jgi:hypothetical protein
MPPRLHRPTRETAKELRSHGSQEDRQGKEAGSEILAGGTSEFEEGEARAPRGEV